MTGEAFVHRWIPSGEALPTLLLLHGTGGDETELLPFARAVAPGAPTLALRGNVSENGKLRFFARRADGSFEDGEVAQRAGELAAFVASARCHYGFGQLVALGFSNGANMAAALMLLHPGVLSGAILLRAVPPLVRRVAAALAAVPVLVVSGEADPIAPPVQGTDLALRLHDCGAEVSHELPACGHDLGSVDISLARSWLVSATFPIWRTRSGARPIETFNPVGDRDETVPLR